jgi:hypothetical protein
MSIKRSSRTLVATLVAASLGATPALATVGPSDRQPPDATPAPATVGPSDRQPPDAQDAAAKAAVIVDKSSPDAAGGRVRDLRVTSSLAGPPPAGTRPIVVVKPAPAPAPAADDGFNFASAAIGAAGAAFVVAAMAGGIAVSRRRRIAATA